MKSALTVVSFALACGLAAPLAHAQGGSTVWRCGNTYTNDAREAQAGGCKQVESRNVTIVEGTKVNSANAVRVANVNPAASGSRIDTPEQKARDAEARSILEAELKKAEARQSELAREWNNGEPEKQGAEGRNHQKYLDRVAELKASMARNENDIAGIKRELSRMGPATVKQ